jgi:hypothetical protein
MAEKESAASNVKKSLGKAADITSLKIKRMRAENRRKEAYRHLGELAYAKHRPRPDDVTEDIDNAIAASVTEITELSQTITELDLRIKLVKAQNT